MKKVTYADRLRYRFDNTMSKGPAALVIWLGAVSAVFILVISFIVTLSGIATPQGQPGPDFFEISWRSLMRAMSSSNVAADAGAPTYLFSMLVVTFGGIFVVTILIGIITTGIQNKIVDLRKGRSFVVESNHTLILGWSPQVFTVISELVEANANQRRSCIVVLADKDKVEMEDEIRSKVGSTHGTRIVCRRGSPLDMTDLEIANPHAARSIIILAPKTADPDTHVIKTLLAITNNPNRKPEAYHIVAEIRDPDKMEVARMVGRGEVEIVLGGDLISRITVQTCRQSGLSVVYTDLLKFVGDEIYFKEEPTLIGKTIGEALFAFKDSSLIGLHRQDGSSQLNPPMDTRIEAGDQVIAITEDDDTIRLSGITDHGILIEAIQTPLFVTLAPERTLILGWNGRGTSIIGELDNYVAPGSKTTIVADVPKTALQIASITPKNQELTFHAGDATACRTLDKLDVTEYQHVIVLSYSDDLGPREADARTLITLLHLRDIVERNAAAFSIVSEMLDVRDLELARVTRADDFIVSDQLVSLMLAQVSENKGLGAVFADLFNAGGSEIYLRPAEDYVQMGIAINFYTVLEAARRRNEIAIGYRQNGSAYQAANAFGIVENPDKSNKVTFGPADKIIVLAEK